MGSAHGPACMLHVHTPPCSAALGERRVRDQIVQSFGVPRGFIWCCDELARSPFFEFVSVAQSAQRWGGGGRDVAGTVRSPILFPRHISGMGMGMGERSRGFVLQSRPNSKSYYVSKSLLCFCTCLCRFPLRGECPYLARRKKQ